MTLALQQPQAMAHTNVRTLPAWTTIAALMLLALAVRLWGLGDSDFWLDEACTYLFIKHPGGIFEALRADVHPPLYFWMLKAWAGLFGDGVLSLRLPSALAGAAAVGAIGLWMARSGCSRRAMLWAMALTAFLPMQIVRSTEARSYSFLFLFVVLAMWAWTRAVESGRWRDWCLHAAFFVLGAYTHHLMLPMGAAFWIAAAVERIGQNNWKKMTLTYAAAGFAVLPALLMILGQNGATHGEDWLADVWRRMSPALAIPRSLEAMGISGQIDIGERGIENIAARILGALLTLAAILAAFDKRKKNENVGIGEFGRHAPLALVCTLWPLLFLWLYSAIHKPMYAYGRYDITAHAGFIALLAVGFARIQRWISERHATAAPLLASLVIAACLWRSVLDPRLSGKIENHFTTERTSLVQANAHPGDQVIAIAYGFATLRYEWDQRGLQIPLSTFPAENIHHPGWMVSNEALEAQMPGLRQEAEHFLSGADAPRRLWVALDQPSADPSTSGKDINGRARMSLVFFDVARHAGYHFVKQPADFADRLPGHYLALLEKTP